MRISPTYANRADLSYLGKVRFSTEEYLGHHRAVRAVYRWYQSLPKVLRDFYEMATLFVAIPAFALIGISFGASRRLFGDKEVWHLGAGTIASTAFLILPGFLVPLYWWLPALFVHFIVLIKFLMIMDEYGD